MQALRNSLSLTRLVMAWFALTLGIAVASPIVQPQHLEMVCGAGGSMQMVVLDDNGELVAGAHHSLDCPLCLSIDTGSRAVSEVRVEGGSLVNGDGLVLDGANRLYVVRNADNELVQLALADGWGSARVEQRLHDARLKYPTTAAKAGNALLVVNGQLNKQKDPPPFLPFDVLSIGLPR